MNKALRQLLLQKAAQYNVPSFIPNDPIGIPHLFSQKQDIEISGFFAATLAWGNRRSIINSCHRLLQLMDNKPYDFIVHHKETDLKPFLHFVHRTFNATDLLYFIHFLQWHYKHFSSLEDAFVPAENYTSENVAGALLHFNSYFFTLEHADRTHKHVAGPQKKSACKRLNMYLRWMVRKDTCGVDFGLWHKIKPAQLVCPLDVHVARVAHQLGLLQDNKANWNNALALTARLKEVCPEDPVYLDFALFGLGLAERI
jgi:uncharacterized protein (TIGR02757 family)